MDSHREMRVDMSLPWMEDKLTYKLEPGLSRISSPIVLMMPDGEKREYKDGKEIVEALFDKRWKVTELRAAGDAIEEKVEETVIPGTNWTGEEQTFF